MQGAVLRVTKPRHKRSRLVTVLLLPALALMWLVGWSMYCIGRATEAKPKTRAKPEETNLTMVPAVTVEEEPLEVQA